MQSLSANLNTLAERSWRIYKNFETEDLIVKPSIPILFFGDSERYLKSKIKVITVGLNPSKTEFPQNERFLRFENARNVYPEILHGKYRDAYLSALNSYFKNKPYKMWFNSFEHILNGLDCSYYGKGNSIALHTDLGSPLATDPTWSKISNDQRIKLGSDGVRLWHSLVKFLAPDVIIVSIAEKYLKRIEFTCLENWKVIYTIQRKNPYEVKSLKAKIKDNKIAIFVFGRAANTPFGTVSSKDKKKIGLFVKEYIYGKGK